MRNCQSAERPNPTISMRKKMDFFIGESEAESNPSIDYSEQQQSLIREFRTEFRVRQKSEDNLTLRGLVYNSCLKQQLSQDKMISDAELLSLRSMIQNLQKNLQKINYYHVILSDTRNLIDFFIDTSRKDMIGIKVMKEIIFKFESLKFDLNKKIQLAQQKSENSVAIEEELNKSHMS